MFTDAEAASNSAPPALTRHMILSAAAEQCCPFQEHVDGADNGVFRFTATQKAIACLFGFRIFAYSVHGRLSQPFPSFLLQLSGAMSASFSFMRI